MGRPSIEFAGSDSTFRRIAVPSYALVIRRVAIIAWTLAASAPLAAQKDGAAPAPRRPALPPAADTCDAYAYYRYGLFQLRRDPAQAAAAFYWTRRLSPDAAVAYYAERVALLLADPRLLRRYFEEDSRTLQSPEVRRLDSLYVRALAIDPYFPKLLDELLIVTYYTNLIHEDFRNHGEEVSELDIEFYVRREIANAGPATSAWLAFGRGQYRQAADFWAREVGRYRKNAYLRARRSQALFLAGEPDSALGELEAALAVARRADAEKMRFVYDSKVLWEYEVGRIHELQGRDSAAREAYQGALVEDLSFHPAHVRLAYVALRAADTATAVTELQRALDIKEDDFSARLLLGTVHAARRAFGPATEQLRRATEIEPWVAQPHLALGDVRRDAGDREGAVAEYQRFLALAARNNPALDSARQRLAGLAAPAR
jgi:Flp pilus assembly protein TadD